MKKIVFLIYFALMPFAFYSCNYGTDKTTSDTEVQQVVRETVKDAPDSVKNAVEELLKTDIKIPPLFDKPDFDTAAADRFKDFASATGGKLKLLVNAALINNEVTKIINAHAEEGADLLLLIDKTHSMVDDIEKVKQGLNKIIGALESHKHVRLAIAFYGDKNEDGPDWFTFKNFEEDYQSAKDFVNRVEVTGGGDIPESIYDAFFKCTEQNFWRSESKRMIILIGDAPPLEKPLSNYSLGDVIRKANEGNIKMNFYPILVTPEIASDSADGPPHLVYEKVKLASTSLYPNPSTGMINMDFDNPDLYNIELYNSAGVLVMKESYSGKNWKKDITNFKDGVYILRASNSDKKFETSKFVLQR